MKKAVKRTTEKYVTEKTFEKHMQSIARSFDRHGKVMQDILKELRQMHEDHKSSRSTLSNFVGDVSLHDRRIENLTMRVERLESKI